MFKFYNHHRSWLDLISSMQSRWSHSFLNEHGHVESGFAEAFARSFMSELFLATTSTTSIIVPLQRWNAFLAWRNNTLGTRTLPMFVCPVRCPSTESFQDQNHICFTVNDDCYSLKRYIIHQVITSSRQQNHKPI